MLTIDEHLLQRTTTVLDDLAVVVRYLDATKTALTADRTASGWRLTIVDQGGEVVVEAPTFGDLARAIRTVNEFLATTGA